MENFYIFLDIDGVLYDWNYLISNNIKNPGIIKTFNPESIKALNYLIEKLSLNYNVALVISSTWRRDMGETVRTLIKNGLKTNLRKIFNTPITYHPNCRGLEILQFLENKKDNKNFVIIDDELFDFLKHFPMQKIIKTDMFKESLNINMVERFLNDNIKNITTLNK